MVQNTSTAVMARRSEPPECWRSVAGWSGYEVSNLGNVRSWKWPSGGRQWIANPERPPRPLRQAPRNGYASVVLSDVRSRRKTMSVHVLVLTAFIGQRPAGFQAAHRDGDPANNSLNNLEWASPVNNNADKRRHGTLVHGEAIASAKLTRADVEAIREARRDGAAVASLAVQYAVCRNTIGNALGGRTWANLANPAPLPDGST
jgi:hypothetical protein